MPITLERNKAPDPGTDEQFGLECPYCGVYAHLTAQAVPDVDKLLKTQPKHIGLVYQCDACHAPIFLRFAVKAYSADKVELFQNFIELERPKERFSFSYLPQQTEVLFREALSCYSSNNFNAFACMCRRSAKSAYRALGEGGKLRSFESVMTAQDIAKIDDDIFDPIKKVLFGTGDEETLPMLNRAQAGVLLEVLKDMFYQAFVRPGKLTRAIKVRNLFVQDYDEGLRPTA